MEVVKTLSDEELNILGYEVVFIEDMINPGYLVHNINSSEFSGNDWRWIRYARFITTPFPSEEIARIALSKYLYREYTHDRN